MLKGLIPNGMQRVPATSNNLCIGASDTRYLINFTSGLNIVLSWWYLAVLDYACIMLFFDLLNISQKCYFVSYSKWWTRVLFGRTSCLG